MDPYADSGASGLLDMLARHSADFCDLARVHWQAQHRKFRDTELFDRLIRADRPSLVRECVELGLPIDGSDDDALRRQLLLRHRGG